MPSEASAEPRELFPAGETAAAFAAASLLFLFTASGIVDTIDADASIETARSLFRNGSWRVDLPQADPLLFAPLPGGGQGSKLGLLFPLLYLPAVALAAALAAPLGLPPSLLEKLFVSLVNPVVTALILAVLFAISRSRGASRSAASLFALAGVLGTYLWAYSKSCHREPVQALLLLVAASALWACPPRRAGRSFLLCGSALGLGVLAKLAFLVPATPIVAWGVARAVRDRAPRAAAALFLPLAIAAGVTALHSWSVWGSPFGTGYSDEVVRPFGSAWGTPFARGLLAQLFGPSGYAWLNPLALTALVWCLVKAARGRLSALDAAALASFGLTAALYARWWAPLGGEALGPRHLVTVTPLLWLTLADFPGRARPKAVLWAAALAIAYQAAHVAVKPGQYWAIRQRAGRDLPLPHWAANLVILRQKLSGAEERYDLSRFGGHGTVDLRDAETLEGFNFWWAHLARLSPQRLDASHDPATDDTRAVARVEKGREGNGGEHGARAQSP